MRQKITPRRAQKRSASGFRGGIPEGLKENQQASKTAAMQNLATLLLDAACQLDPERPFYPYQREFGQAVILAMLTGTGEEMTALFARQSGKTETIARVAVLLCLALPTLAKQYPYWFKRYRDGVWIGIFAPVKEQAGTAFERMLRYFGSNGTHQKLEHLELNFIEKNKTSRVLSNGSFIRMWSANVASNIESKTLHLAIVEEAQDVIDIKIQKSIEPMLTATGGSMILIGTANAIKSAFWRSIQNNLKKAFQSKALKTHFEFNWKTVALHNSEYNTFLNKKIHERGSQWVESDAFRMSYNCEFILERGQFLTFARLQELETLGRNIPCGPYSNGQCTVNAPMVAGIDWGKSGDSTVVTVIAKMGSYSRIIDWLELNGDNYDLQFESIVAFLARFPTLECILAETNGVGDPMTDRLKLASQKKQLRAPVFGFLATASNNSDGYKNLQIDFINTNRLLMPADNKAGSTREYQKFTLQLTDAIKIWRGSLLRVEAGQGCNGKSKQGARHDDYVSSLMIAYWAASQQSSDGMFNQFYGDNQNGSRLPKT